MDFTTPTGKKNTYAFIQLVLGSIFKLTQFFEQTKLTSIFKSNTRSAKQNALQETLHNYKNI